MKKATQKLIAIGSALIVITSIANFANAEYVRTVADTPFGLLSYDDGVVSLHGNSVYPHNGENDLNFPHELFRVSESNRETIAFSSGSNGCPGVFWIIQIDNKKIRVLDNITDTCNDATEVFQQGSEIVFATYSLGEDEQLVAVDIDSFSKRTFSRQTKSISSNPLHLVDEYPQGIVTSRFWKPKFVELLGRSYADFVEQIGFASPPKVYGSWLIASGRVKYSEHLTGIFAIHIENKQIIAALGNKSGGVTRYGFTQTSEAPLQMQRWIEAGGN